MSIQINNQNPIQDTEWDWESLVIIAILAVFSIVIGMLLHAISISLSDNSAFITDKVFCPGLMFGPISTWIIFMIFVVVGFLSGRSAIQKSGGSGSENELARSIIIWFIMGGLGGFYFGILAILFLAPLVIWVEKGS